MGNPSNIFNGKSPILDLNDGQSIPQLGLGCYKSLGEDAENAIRWAAEAGYRHFDSAAFYANEPDVGKALKTCGLSREEYFLTTKIWPTCYGSPRNAVEYGLKALACDYVDAWLLHWPGADRNARLRAWETLLNYRERGLIRSVGVSNFMKDQLEDLISEFGVVPVLDQVELHPWRPQRELREYCRQKDILITAWGPIFRGHIDEVPLMTELAQKYGRSPAQVTLRWHIQTGNIVIPKSVHQERIVSNIDVFDFTLSQEDMASIGALACDRHFCHDPYTFDGGDFVLPPL